MAIATGMGILAVSWLTTGITKLLLPAGSTSAALGVLLLFAGLSQACANSSERQPGDRRRFHGKE